jgi:hypothetical protein
LLAVAEGEGEGGRGVAGEGVVARAVDARVGDGGPELGGSGGRSLRGKEERRERRECQNVLETDDESTRGRKKRHTTMTDVPVSTIELKEPTLETVFAPTFAVVARSQ